MSGVREVLLRALRPPVRDRRFWVVQALVLAIAVGHEAADADNFLGPLGVPAFATVGLFLVPIVYAALNFGLPGSLATGLLVTALTLPDLFVVNRLTEHQWVDGVQLAIIDAVAIFVGQRVERERLARKKAEDSGDALRKAEARYRALFVASPAPILVVEREGQLREANPAAKALLPAALAGSPIVELLGVPYAEICAGEVDLIKLRDAQGQERELRPSCASIDTEDGPMVQVVLHDATEELRERQRIAAYAAHVVQVQEEERRRIGQEIHDEPLQALVQLNRKLMTNGKDPQTVVKQVADSGVLLTGIIDDLRKIAHGLRPPVLDDLGVVPALRRLVDEFAERNALEVNFAVSGEIRRLGPELELSLFRIAQEALHNVERHAAARHVKLRLKFGPQSAAVEVEDDGIGFDAGDAQRSPESIGLLGMKERAELLSGSFSVHSKTDAGTTVRAELPLA
jgi:signal transduction histidine kinase